MSESFRKIPVSELLRRVAAARAAGDWKTAKGEWWASIARAIPRVEFKVDYFVHRKLVPSHRRDDLVQESLKVAARRLVHNLDKLDDEDAFFAAVVTATTFVCKTEGRNYKRDKQRMRSLDATTVGPDGDEVPAGMYGEIADQATASWQAEMDSLELGEALGRALRTLTEKERAAFLGPHVGVSDAELAHHFKTSPNNIQQIRSRTIRKLAQNKELRGLIDP